MRAVLFVRGDLAIVLFDDRLCHRKPNTVAPREASRLVGTVETVKKSVKRCLANGRIGILNRQHDSSATLERNVDLTARIAILDRVIH